MAVVAALSVAARLGSARIDRTSARSLRAREHLPVAGARRAPAGACRARRRHLLGVGGAQFVMVGMLDVLLRAARDRRAGIGRERRRGAGRPGSVWVCCSARPAAVGLVGVRRLAPAVLRRPARLGRRTRRALGRVQHAGRGRGAGPVRGRDRASSTWPVARCCSAVPTTWSSRGSSVCEEALQMVGLAVGAAAAPMLVVAVRRCTERSWLPARCLVLVALVAWPRSARIDEVTVGARPGFRRCSGASRSSRRSPSTCRSARAGT